MCSLFLLSSFFLYFTFFHVRSFAWVSENFFVLLSTKHWVVLLTELLCMVTWLDSLRGTPSVGFFVSFLPDQSPQKGYPCLLLGDGGLAACCWRDWKRVTRIAISMCAFLLGATAPSSQPDLLCQSETCSLPLKESPDFAGWFQGSHPRALYWGGSPEGSYCFLNSF